MTGSTRQLVDTFLAVFGYCLRLLVGYDWIAAAYGGMANRVPPEEALSGQWRGANVFMAEGP